LKEIVYEAAAGHDVEVVVGAADEQDAAGVVRMKAGHGDHDAVGGLTWDVRAAVMVRRGPWFPACNLAGLAALDTV
jgi:hypothetical protein